jgi:hypothetical protein
MATAKTYNLWLADLETGTKTLLKQGIDISFSDIWEDYVTFSRGNKIYLIDINQPDDETLISEVGYSARIRDGKIVYTKLGAAGGYHIYAYVIVPKKTIDVAGPLTYLPQPIIFENLIAYDAAVSDSPIDMDVFLTYL